MSEARRDFRRRWALQTAAPMFWISLVFLANTAMSIVLWVDVPRVTETYSKRAALAAQESTAEVSSAQPMQEIEQQAHDLGMFTLLVAILLWPIFVAEFLFYYFFSAVGDRRFTAMGLLACCCPPLRLGAPNPAMRERIWLPKLGWTRRTVRMRKELEKHFSAPMIVIALMILPILLVEFGLKEEVIEHNWLRITLHASTGTIWFAFALEFIVICSVSPKKLRYCKVHWLDLAIILLPLLSFLRSLRILRATRLARLAKVQQLSKLGRVYHMRGLAIKGFRGLTAFEVMNRLLRITPERQLEILQEQLAEIEGERRDLRQRIASVELMIAAQKEAEAAEDASMRPEVERHVTATESDIVAK